MLNDLFKINGPLSIAEERILKLIYQVYLQKKGATPSIDFIGEYYSFLHNEAERIKKIIIALKNSALEIEERQNQ